MNQYMNMAMDLALMVDGQTGQNPPVGAIIVKDGRVIGLGAHLKQGDLHAERQALENCQEQAYGADMYVSLEPCSHHGTTPPCTDAIIEAGIDTVYYAFEDINPDVFGHQVLNDHGISTELMTHPDAEELYRPFTTRITEGRPFVTVKCAMSLDGKLAMPDGQSHWVSNEASRQDVHQLRHLHEAILIGGHTLETDNPRLTTRLEMDSRDPVPVVLLGSQALIGDMNILKHPHRPIIFTNNKDNLNYDHVCDIHYGDFSPEDVMQTLSSYKIASVLVEGGSNTITRFLDAYIYDNLIIYIAPKIFGYSEYQLYDSVIQNTDDSIQLTLHDVEKLGSDIKLTYRRASLCSQV